MASLAMRLAMAALLCAIPARGGALRAEQSPAGQQPLTPQQLQQLVAPIALYPDNLLAQLLMASTYPLEIVEAARWVQAHPKLAGPELQKALLQELWDPTVKSMTAVPRVLKMMDDQLDWTQKLGDAFLAQQAGVLQAVQTLRGKAQDTGSLKTTSQQTVSTSQAEGKTCVMITPADPQMVYVPSDNPATIYGAWPYPSLRPYSFAAAPPPGGSWPAGAVTFGAGAAAGAALWGSANWGAGSVGVNIAKFNSFNNANIDRPEWRHDPGHRGGVPYPNRDLAQRFSVGANRNALEDFRGRTLAGAPNQGGRAGRGIFGPNDLEPRINSLEGLGRGDEVCRQSERGRESRARVLERRRMKPVSLHERPRPHFARRHVGRGRRRRR